jgi:hypothetical protein
VRFVLHADGSITWRVGGRAARGAAPSGAWPATSQARSDAGLATASLAIGPPPARRLGIEVRSRHTIWTTSVQRRCRCA